MIDLRGISGIDVKFTGQEIIFGPDLIDVKPIPRLLGDARKVLIDESFGNNDTVLYLMYRGVARKSDIDIFKKYKLRYDITVMFPIILGEEFNKTIGHYHPNIEGKDISFPEIYEVISGKAHYLAQDVSYNDSPQTVKDVLVYNTAIKEKVYIRPNYGHITINPSKNDVLIMTNLMANLDEFNSSSIYKPFKEAKGGTWYEISNGQFVKNENYKNNQDIKIEKSIDLPKLGLLKDKPLYDSFIEDPEKFNYLINPELI